MMTELIAFIIILIIDVISFTSIYFFLFRNKIEEFDSYFHAFSNLIGFGLGGFSFATIKED